MAAIGCSYAALQAVSEQGRLCGAISGLGQMANQKALSDLGFWVDDRSEIQKDFDEYLNDWDK